jgi:hypothetical protein
MLRLYDCQDVLKVASFHDSLVQLNLDPRRPVAGSAMVVARGWADPLPELASCTPEWSPIVFRHFAGLIAAALITPRLAAPIVMSVRVDTGVGGPTS